MSDVPCLASVVIVTYGQRAMTEACLDSLQAALGDELGRSFELILVDNASPDDTLGLLRAWSDRAVVLEQPFNRNFSGGCNDGARVARGEVLVFLNNDTIVHPGALEGLVQTAREPGVGAAGLRLLYPDGLLQHAGMLTRPDTVRGGPPVPSHMLYRHDGEIPAGRATYELDVVTGACLAMERAVFEELGGFDEEYVNGYEDVDLCLRARVSGRSVVYRGDLVIEHHESASRKGVDDNPNLARMLSIWGGMLEADVELIAETWDAAIAPLAAPRTLAPSDFVVVGEVSGFGPHADEVRALLLALERAGRPAAGVDLTPIRVCPALSGATGAAAQRALQRSDATGPVLRIDVPFGVAWTQQAPPEALLRVGRAAPDGRTRNVLAATPAGGGPWLPPAIDAPGTAGPGGGGVLVSLPAHDAPAARAVLEGLAAAAVAGVPVRIVPTVLARGLTALVAEVLPEAELLGPCGDEDRWAELAQTADVAVCLDADDLFERRALVAAAAGATILVGPAGDGPAEAVLGERAHVVEPAGLAAALPRALAVAGDDRAGLAQLVRDTCAPEVVGHRFLALIGQAAAAVAA